MGVYRYFFEWRRDAETFFRDALRANPNFEHMKIIIVSGVVNQDEINDLLKAGADEFVKKPFNIEKLIGRVGELLSV